MGNNYTMTLCPHCHQVFSLEVECFTHNGINADLFEKIFAQKVKELPRPVKSVQAFKEAFVLAAQEFCRDCGTTCKNHKPDNQFCYPPKPQFGWSPI
jgi:hypothetical protein